MDVYIGFDSAWADNPKMPGAICAVDFEGSTPVRFYEPRLVSFSQAHTFIRDRRSSSGNTLIALDQPTIVPNETSMRPVERVVAALIGWLGGGVQPSNRRRLGMFCDASPIWRFLDALGAVQDPEQSRLAVTGLYLIEVFPALALASLTETFFGRLKGPRYNPGRRKTFRLNDWVRVAEVAAQESEALQCRDLADWCRKAAKIARPSKADQDMMDSVLCVLIAMYWRLRPRKSSVVLGDLAAGYMVSPASPMVRAYLAPRAQMFSVALDGEIAFNATLIKSK